VAGWRAMIFRSPLIHDCRFLPWWLPPATDGTLASRCRPRPPCWGLERGESSNRGCPSVRSRQRKAYDLRVRWPCLGWAPSRFQRAASSWLGNQAVQRFHHVGPSCPFMCSIVFAVATRVPRESASGWGLGRNSGHRGRGW
jgi:hypothetical protein